MHLKFRSMMLAAVVSTLGLTSSICAQPVPGPHPAYLHALSDLRAARHYLNDGWAWAPVRREDNAAIAEIDAAINYIKQASIDDGKGLNDPFPIDTGLTPHGRFLKAAELLLAARNDISRAEDLPQARGLRNQAKVHIERAENIVNDVEQSARWQ